MRRRPSPRFTRPRLEKVAAGEDPGGITKAVEWNGGGGLWHVKVRPSMFDLDPESGDVSPPPPSTS